jgi:hypothetical protein
MVIALAEIGLAGKPGNIEDLDKRIAELVGAVGESGPHQATTVLSSGEEE